MRTSMNKEGSETVTKETSTAKEINNMIANTSKNKDSLSSAHGSLSLLGTYSGSSDNDSD